MLAVLEIKLFQEFLKPKEKFYEDEELHLLRINKTDYEYCHCNFLKQNITINKENPMLDSYIKTFASLESQLLETIKRILKKIEINLEEVHSYDYLATSIKNYNATDIVKYFFKIFESAVVLHSKKEMKEALNEFIISKYLYEIIIFIRLISLNKQDTLPFSKLFPLLENESEIMLFSNDNQKLSKDFLPNNLVVFTFLGGIIKTFKDQKILEEETSESILQATHDSIESIIKFYPEIITMIVECSAK
jgi:hypothetical protein